VIVSALPSSPEAFAKAAWDDIAPYYDELIERPLEPGNIEAWLRACPLWRSCWPRLRRVP